ncbi:fructose-bisphosphate aldolase class I [Candidatus Saccharibacteria bacterium]|nr:fructose-bisphosphate aldolase class I [Candidatus Saccharibacteria bacterium]
MRVCVVGQYVKDVYLQIAGEFLRDEDNIEHLDLAFDGSEQKLLRRTATMSGSAVVSEVLYRMGHKVDYVDDTFPPHRYILNNGRGSVVLSGANEKVFWQPPKEAPDAIFVDDTSLLSRSEMKKIEKYAKDNDVILCGHGDESFFQGQPDISCPLSSPVDHISIFANGLMYTVQIETSKGNIHSISSLRSLIHASIIGTWLLGYDTASSLAIAKGMVEQSTLTSTPRLADILEGLGDLRATLRVEGSELAKTAQQIMSLGILAADESGGSIAKRFASLGIPDDEQHRRDYRNVLLGLPELAKYSSGVILFDETTTQLADNGQNFTDFLATQGIIPGVKVDQGLVDFGKKGEKTTEGLFGLPERLKIYYERGLRFAKWRSAFFVADGTPSTRAIDENCKALAQYALDCQEAGIVPIVEPELVHDGNYSIDDCAKYTEKFLVKLFECLKEYRVELPGTILKVNMVLAGKKFKKPSTAEEVGRATAVVLKKTVPRELAGVVFLSGGQTPEGATANLKAVWTSGPFMWPVTYSFARALQDPAFNAWKGDNKNVDKARKAFLKRLIANSRD